MSSKKKTKNKPSILLYQSKGDYPDRAAENQNKLETFTVNINDVYSAVLLLKSKENDVILTSLHNLDKFSMKHEENLLILYNAQVLPPLFLHITSEHLFIRRFTFKIISGILRINNCDAKSEILENDELLNSAIETYADTTDNFLIEYLTIILNAMFENSKRVELILENSKFFPKLFNIICQTKDPDALYESLELFIRTLQCPEATNQIFQDNNSNNSLYSFLLTTMQNEYAEIQMSTLKLINQLAQLMNFNSVEAFFRDPLLMNEIFFILENSNSVDLDMALKILEKMVKRPVIGEPFFQDATMEQYMKFVNNTIDNKHRVMGVLVELTNYPNAHQILDDLNVCTIFMDSLKLGTTFRVPTGIANLSNYKSSLEFFLNENAVELLFDHLGNENTPIEDKKEIASSLTVLFKLSPIACNTAIKCGGVKIISDLMATENSIQFILLGMLESLSKQRNLKSHIMTTEMATSLNSAFNASKSSSCISLNVEMIKCLSIYLSEFPLRDQLLQMTDFTKILIQYLSPEISSLILKISTVEFIISCKNYPELTNKFIDEYVLDCFLKDHDSLASCPKWSEAIAIILANNLPMKFAIQGVLELTDRTDDDFYATKKIWKNYRRLKEIFYSECSPKRPIILCNFKNIKKSISEVASKTTISVESASGEDDEELQPTYDRRPGDPYLSKHLRIIQESMTMENISLKSGRSNDQLACIKLIANFVATKLCFKPFPSKPSNIDSSITDSDNANNNPAQLINKHLEDLKTIKFNCNIIPLGFIRIGGYFERSLLFKVIADRIDLSVSLNMSKDNHQIVWNEVFIPAYEPHQNCDDPSILNTTVTHIVDLMENPGEVYAIGCLKAENYLKSMY